MAKKRSPAGPASANSGESISGYFRKIFAETPNLLKTRSNAQVVERWLADHPGHKAVPQSVLWGLQNVKSALRSRKRKRRKAQAAASEAAGVPVATAAFKRPKPSMLETLEEQIDDCLTAAKLLDREGLDDVIRMLRRARNNVVWKLGQ